MSNTKSKPLEKLQFLQHEYTFGLPSCITLCIRVHCKQCTYWIARVDSTILADAVATLADISFMGQHSDTFFSDNNQYILLASTPKKENAKHTCNKVFPNQTKPHRVCHRNLHRNNYEISGHKAGLHFMCRGVIWGIPVQDGSVKIDEKTVHDISVDMAAKCIGSTTAVIVTFDKDHVPNLVQYKLVLLQCTL